MAVHMGYIGSAQISSVQASIPATPIFLTGSSINPVQNLNAPDIVQGQYVKHLWNYGPIEIGGNITGPVASNHQSVFDAAWYRYGVTESSGVATSTNPTDGDHMNAEDIVLEISYYRSSGRKFNRCAINSYEVSVMAGDVANFTVDFMGAAVPLGSGVEGQYGASYNYPASCLKLVTWDRCSFGLTPLPTFGTDAFEVQAFTFTVNNNIQRIYKIDTSGNPQDKLYPLELVAGFRDLTGSVTVFAEGGAPENLYAVWDDTTAGFGAEAYDTYDPTTGNNFSVNMLVGAGGGFVTPIIDQTFKIFFRRPEASSRTDVQVYTLNYQALCTPSFS